MFNISLSLVASLNKSLLGGLVPEFFFFFVFVFFINSYHTKRNLNNTVDFITLCLACDAGYYGIDCRYKCSNCSGQCEGKDETRIGKRISKLLATPEFVCFQSRKVISSHIINETYI
ncbi:unnamed protein product [Lymnaea stagnalis]|uniref:Uncharacterized protein n=1 Tax=Lymnaea stagnalis TaxID=6523 RepID=A0AAV2HE87_LYMST